MSSTSMHNKIINCYYNDKIDEKDLYLLLDFLTNGKYDLVCDGYYKDAYDTRYNIEKIKSYKKLRRIYKKYKKINEIKMRTLSIGCIYNKKYLPKDLCFLVGDYMFSANTI